MAGLSLAATEVRALDGAIPIPLATVTIGGGATYNGSISLPGAGNPVLAFDFVLPPDYANNQPVKIVMHLYSSATCTMHLRDTTIARYRIGRAPALGSTGFGPSDGTLFVNLSANKIAGKTFNVTRPAGGLSTQRPGDAIRVSFDRYTDAVEDNCGDVLITAIQVVYPRP